MHVHNITSSTDMWYSEFFISLPVRLLNSLFCKGALRYVNMKDGQFDVQSTESARSKISKNHTILFNNIVTSYQLLLTCWLISIT
jgi:hypothetical protein